jgi:hypothetical protein
MTLCSQSDERAADRDHNLVDFVFFDSPADWRTRTSRRVIAAAFHDLSGRLCQVARHGSRGRSKVSISIMAFACRGETWATFSPAQLQALRVLMMAGRQLSILLRYEVRRD